MFECARFEDACVCMKMIFLGILSVLCANLVVYKSDETARLPKPNDSHTWSSRSSYADNMISQTPISNSHPIPSRNMILQKMFP